MSDVLVIHPSDETTNMLKYVYKGKMYDVITNPNVSKEELKKQIKSHSKIIMLGHGTPNGLINPLFAKNPFTFKGDIYLIDDSFADILKEKETISIWCYSDLYFKRHNMSGFHTGMIISEVKEANYVLGYCPLSKEELYNNMVIFSKLLGECIEFSAKEMYCYMKDNYKKDNQLTKFNWDNIIYI